MARRVGRPRAGDPEATRRQILRAAEESFAAVGFTAATTRDMAARAGVNVATLHYHFGDKRSLYRAVREESVRGEVPLLPETGGARTRLGVLLASLYDFTARRGTLARLSLLDLLDGERAVADPRALSLESALGALGVSGARERAALLAAFLDASLLAARDGDALERARGMYVAAALAAAGLD